MEERLEVRRVRIECDGAAALGAAFLRAESDPWVDDCIVDSKNRVLTVSWRGPSHLTARSKAEWRRRVRAIQGS